MTKKELEDRCKDLLMVRQRISFVGYNYCLYYNSVSTIDDDMATGCIYVPIYQPGDVVALGCTRVVAPLSEWDDFTLFPADGETISYSKNLGIDGIKT